jgi:organic radical activating enzyme
MPDKYLSIITNFGCHYTCPYCIVKNNGIDIPKTTIDGLDKLVENIRKYDCNWVSISGGGDPLYDLEDHINWYNELFDMLPCDVKLELHTSYFSGFVTNWPLSEFDRVVYHCRKPSDLFKIRRYGEDQKVRAVFVVTKDFTPALIDDITTIVRHSPDIDELSFRQMVDGNYNTTHYCEDYLKQGHQKDWWYIEQNDYNIYYTENEVSFKYEDFKKPLAP